MDYTHIHAMACGVLLGMPIGAGAVYFGAWLAKRGDNK